MVDFGFKFKNMLEYYLIPICFFIGFIGNSLGSICILSNKKSRERTPLFIQAFIGLSDNFLLISQLQRWLAVFFDQKFFLISNSLCKVYFMILRTSILISSVLTFFLPLIRFISLYLGHFRLSTYSNLGQILSRLSVAYVLSIGLSLSWHELWTSGLKYGEEPLVEIDPDYEINSVSSTTRPISYDNLKCHKNIISYSIIHAINLIYFVILFSINLGLIVLPFLLYFKIKNPKNEIAWNRQRPKSKSYSLPLNRTNLSLDKFNWKTFSLVEINGHELKFVNQNNKTRTKKFTIYICLVSIISGIFCLPYAILDLSYYKDAQVNFSLNHTNSSTEKIHSLNRLPLLLIIIPHFIKFYLLFFSYPRFRKQIGNFLKIRLYVDFYLLKNQFKAKPAGSKNSGICSKTNNKLFVINRFNSSKKDQSVNKKRSRKIFKKYFQITSRINDKTICLSSDSESSSIMGYNISQSINRPMLSLSNTRNYDEICDLDKIDIPIVSSPVKKLVSTSTFDFIDKSKCISNSESSISIKN